MSALTPLFYVIGIFIVALVLAPLSVYLLNGIDAYLKRTIK